MTLPPWRIVVGIVSLGATALFLAFLALLPMLGLDPVDERWVAPIIAIGVGLGAGALGGEASVKGKFPIKALNNQPVATSATGGIAVFLIVLFAVPYALPVRTVAPIRDFDLTGRAVGADRVALEARFDASGLSRTHYLQLAAFEDEDCRREITTARIDQPMHGTMTLFLRRARSGVQCGRIVIVDADGHVISQTRTRRVNWDGP